MNEVVPRNEVRRHQIGLTESPFFAKVKVERALNDPSSMRGLMECIRQNGISLDDSQLEYHKRRVIEKIDRDEWFLITDKPFKLLEMAVCKVERGTDVEPASISRTVKHCGSELAHEEAGTSATSVSDVTQHS